jgi:hypothetical protein
MAKIYVNIYIQSRGYKMNKLDISKVHSIKKRSLPQIPQYNDKNESSIKDYLD